jgi:hypothetical protein
MMQLVLVGIGAGATSALLFASLASGSLLAILLFYLSPLPIMIAAVGWGHLSGLMAGILAAAGLGFVLNIYFLVAFLLCIGLPAWWLSYLVLLARPVAADGPANIEWFPVGRIVLWSAIAGTAAVAVIMLLVLVATSALEIDRDALRAALRESLERFFRGGLQPPGSPARLDPDLVVDLMIVAIPPAVAVLLTMLSLFNLWLAGRIVNVSGRLRRPWPDLSAISLPRFALGALAGAVAGSFLPGLAGRLSSVFAASLFMAYAVMGFAVLHAITRGMGSRAFALTGAYVAVFVLSWPILIVALLGLAETAFNIRDRFALKGPPPTSPR